MQDLYTEISTENFQKRFKELLKLYNGTYAELTKALDLKSETFISNLIDGSSAINISTIEKIAKFFGVSPVWLMGYNVDKHYEYKRMESL